MYSGDRIDKPSAARIDAAVSKVSARFPFDNYMSEPTDAYASVARTVVACLTPGSKVLDFGAGPCDKLAVLSELGYECTAYDDLRDPWHHDKRDDILRFAADSGIDYVMAGEPKPWATEEFDMVMLHDVLEHLHDSPRELLTDLLRSVRPHGYLFVTVPNAVNIRKRVAVLFGRTNHPPFDQYWWSPSPWRGHIREYTEGDLRLLARHLGVVPLELRGCHHMLGKVPPRLRPVYRRVTQIFPNWRDSWMLLARKPEAWRADATQPSADGASA